VAIWERVNIPTNKDPLYPHWYGPAFTRSQIVSLFPTNKGINWEFAKTYGHDKWKDMVIKDFNLEA
jgi:hypothetical protein